MKQVLATLLCATLLSVLSAGIAGNSAQSQTIDQKLSVLRNDMAVGGQFNIAVQVRGTGLPAANTLGAATIDVQFNNAKLSFSGDANWAFGSAQGYSRFATNQTTYIHVGLTGSVNSDGGGVPPGFDIGSSYSTWVQLNFTIISTAGTTSLTIDPGSNAIALYGSHGNESRIDDMSNQPLSTPLNITDAALPIQLVSFTASPVSGSSGVQLKWQTLSEIDNFGFEVERSLELEGPFEAIAGSFVAGHGTTAEAQNYSFTDPNTEKKNWYYRLKQTDRSGAVNYSEAVQASTVASVAEERLLPTTFGLDQNYPNPFNPETSIQFALPQDTRVQLRVYNILGQLVATLVDEVRLAGFHTVRFNASSFGSGVYIYRLAAGKQVFVKKMVLVK